LTLAAAFAPLLAFDEVFMRVFTFVFVKACDSECAFDSEALPDFAPDFAPDPDFDPVFPTESSPDSLRTLFFSLCSVLKRYQYFH